MSFKLKIQTKTWSKDNYGLFDYDLEKDMILKEMVVKAEGTLARRLDEVLYHIKSRKGGSTNEIQDDAPMLTIKQTEGGVKVSQPEGNSKQQVLWKQVSRDSNEFACVSKGDTFRLGKKQFTVLQVYLGGKRQKILDLDTHYNVSNIMNTFISDMDQSKTSFGEHDGDAPIMERSERMPCRICLSSSSSRRNPLLAPCQCKGSARWIHFECLQQWINQRIQISEKAHYANIRTKCIKCELCMTLLPSSVNVGPVEYLLYQFRNLKYDKFLVLEDSDGLIFMLNLTSKTSFTIGRGHDCDIKLSEITVSRKHMRLEIDGFARIKLFDLNSKFGTLVKVLKPLAIPYETPLELQNGRTHIKLRLIQKKSSLRNFFSKLCLCRREELDSRLRSEMKYPGREESNIRYFYESQSAQNAEQDSQIEDRQAPEVSPSRAVEENSYFNDTGEMNFPNSQDENVSRQFGMPQRQALLGIHADTSLRSNSQPRDVRYSSVGSAGAAVPQQAGQILQLAFSLRQRNTSLQRQQSLLERAPTSHQHIPQLISLDNHQQEQTQFSEDIRMENEDESERLETDQQDTQQQQPTERSNSVPFTIPHSSSAPSIQDQIVPFGDR